MSPYRRSPRPLSLALERARGDWEPDTVLADAQRVWRSVVGEAIAAEAEPTQERAGVLTINCSASVWAQELELMGPSILPLLNAALRSGSVTRLRCVSLPRAR